MAATTFSFKKEPILEQIINKEWLLTNGIGGYASSTISGLNTRKYHGLLIAALHPPSERYVLLSKLEELIEVEQALVPFNTTHYPGTVHPHGFKKLKSFKRSPFPAFVFKHNGYQLKKELCMHQGHNTLVVKYTNTGKGNFKLKVRPHFLNRSHHGLQEEVKDCFWYEDTGKLISVENKFSPVTLFCKRSGGKFIDDPVEYYHVEYQKEIERGQEFQEHTASLGYWEVELQPKEDLYLTFSTEKAETRLDPEIIFDNEKKHSKDLIPKGIKDDFTKDLISAYDQFKVWRKSTDSHSVIAGYPWFTDWGRDTMIVLRGATLALKDYKSFKSIIRTFFKYINKGILPNRFPDSNAIPEYNTVDATLWSFSVLHQYYKESKDLKFIEEIIDPLTDILNWHFKGTHYGIKANAHGFIEAGTEETQLTWMDAKVGDHVETPRNGCAVEIQGLWYNALKITSLFLKKLNKPIPEEYSNTIALLEKNFKPYFLNENGYLNDVIIPDERIDNAIRPNQVFVLTLPFNLLSEKESEQVLKIVEQHILTSYGLRTLTPEHPFFRANYKGDLWSRDTAYHQGTVWPFLLGDYFEAYLKIHKYSEKAKDYVVEHLKDLKHHFYEEECIHGISEVFDGLTPYHGKGCINQAWSVSGILGVILRNKLEV